MPRRDYNLSRSRNLPDKNDYASILRSTTRVTRAKISDLISAGIVVQSPNSCKLIFSEKVPRLCAKITRDAWINDGTESYTSVSSWLSSNLLRYGIKITLTEDVAWTMVDFCGKNFAIICDAYWNYCAKRGRFAFTNLSVDSILHKHKPSKEVTTLIKYTSEIKQKILDIIGDGQLPKSGNIIVMDFNKSSGNENGDDGDNDIKSSDGTDDSLSSSLSTSSQLADGKRNNNQSKGRMGSSKESSKFYNIKFNDCKVPALRTDFFFLENGEGDKIDSSSSSSSDDDDSKSRKHADYIPYDLASSVECPLCFNVMDNPVVFPCSTGHPACLNCVKKLIKFSVGVSTGKVESHIPVKCPVCSEVAQLPVKACDIETFFRKFEPSAKAAEFISFFMSKDRASLPAPLSCPKHGSEFVSYDVGAGIPLCKDCVAERGAGAGIVLPMKTCANIVKHTADVLCSASSEFEDRCVDYVNTLEQAAVFSGRSVRNVENAINAEADFLHSLIDKKRASLSYNAHKIAKQRCK